MRERTIYILRMETNIAVDMKKKYDKTYIEFAQKKVNDVLNDEREFSDWTQICFSMKDAIKALASIIGKTNDESIHILNSFLLEMTCKMIENLDNYDITFKKKKEN